MNEEMEIKTMNEDIARANQLAKAQAGYIKDLEAERDKAVEDKEQQKKFFVLQLHERDTTIQKLSRKRATISQRDSQIETLNSEIGKLTHKTKLLERELETENDRFNIMSVKARDRILELEKDIKTKPVASVEKMQDAVQFLLHAWGVECNSAICKRGKLDETCAYHRAQRAMGKRA